MPTLKVRFDEPEHGRIGLFILANDKLIVECDASRIYDSLEQLVTALGAMLDMRDERLVTWLEGAPELELRFSRLDDVVQLEITSFEGSERPREKPTADWTFVGPYDEICLPFWRALRNLEGRYSAEELVHRWKGYFPHRGLAFLTEQLGKD